MTSENIIIREYSEQDFFQLVEVYRSAFSEPPWNEYKKCSYCGENYGIKELELPIKKCKKCNISLSLLEFWSNVEIKKDLDFALSQRECVILIAESNRLMSGFLWGYKLPLEKFPFLKGKVDINSNYMDEIAVAGNSRNRGIGKSLGNEYIKRNMQKNTNEIILRTDERNTASMRLFSSLGFQSLYIYDPEFSYRIYLKRRLK